MNWRSAGVVMLYRWAAPYENNLRHSRKITKHVRMQLQLQNKLRKHLKNACGVIAAASQTLTYVSWIIINANKSIKLLTVVVGIIRYHNRCSFELFCYFLLHDIIYLTNFTFVNKFPHRIQLHKIIHAKLYILFKRRLIYTLL